MPPRSSRRWPADPASAPPGCLVASSPPGSWSPQDLQFPGLLGHLACQASPLRPALPGPVNHFSSGLALDTLVFSPVFLATLQPIRPVGAEPGFWRAARAPPLPLSETGGPAALPRPTASWIVPPQRPFSSLSCLRRLECPQPAPDSVPRRRWDGVGTAFASVGLRGSPQTGPRPPHCCFLRLRKKGHPPSRQT